MSKFNERINWALCPSQVRDELKRYQEHRMHTGGFLKAVLCDELQSAIVRADPSNLRDLKEIVTFIYHEMDPLSNGSREKVKAWLLREDILIKG